MDKIYDLKQRTYQYSLEIIKALENLQDNYITRTLGKQLLRSATSIGANIIEAKASSSRKDFINYYTHSLKSANESKFWLSLLRDIGKMSTEKAHSLLNETNELSNILASSILTMKNKRYF